MIFVVFISTFSQAIMSCTIGCRCWADADPEKQSLMMVVSSPHFNSPGPNDSADAGTPVETGQKLPVQMQMQRMPVAGRTAELQGVPPRGLPQARTSRKGSVYIAEESDMLTIQAPPKVQQASRASLVQPAGAVGAHTTH